MLIALTDGANGYVIADAVQLLEVANNGPSEVTWPFDLTQSGTYEVYARWTAAPNRASNARYGIRNGGTQQSVAIDQTLNGEEWQLLTTLNLDASQSVEVTLNDVADGYVIADAVELRRIGGGDGQEIYYLHTDHLGTPRAATDANQTVVWRWEGKPFGETAAVEDPDGDMTDVTVNLRFPGQYFDMETGQHYNYFRTYDPSIGRYTQSDPIGLDGGLNTYAYVGGNPLKSVDPFGLVEWTGTQSTVAASLGGGAVRYKFELETKCINGKKATVEVVAGGQMLSAGIPASYTYSRSVTFRDDLSDPQPSVFSGSAKYVVASWAMTFAGASAQIIQLGDAIAVGSGHQMGWDASVTAGAGVSTAVDSKIETCGCE